MTTAPSNLRSAQNEAARTQALMQLTLQHQVAVELTPDSERLTSVARSMWRKQQEPLAFDEFVWEVAGVELFPRQVDAWDLPGILRAGNLFSAQRTITEFLLVWGKRSGKDMFASLATAYMPYVLSHFAEDPCVFMAREAKKNIAPGTRMDVVNVAPNEDLASQVFFEYLKRWLSSPLFRAFHIYPHPDRWKPGTNHIVFPDIDLHLYSKTSKSSGLDGFNLLAWIMDEADEFLDNAEKSNADRIHNIFRRTAHTTFGPFSVGFIISYPRYEEGFVLRQETRFRKANQRAADEGRPPLFYVDKVPTHEMRPDFNLDDPAIQEEFDNDPKGASAMYLCQPMAAESAFFDRPERVTESVDDARPVLAVVTETFPTSFTKDGREVQYVCAEVEDIVPVPGHTYFLTIDGGVTGDSYAVCVGHIEESNEAALWLCPQCGAWPELKALAAYRRLDMAEAVLLRADGTPTEDIVCGACEMTPFEVTPITGNRGWFRKISDESHAVKIDGVEFHLPHIYEDLLIEIQPQRARQGQTAKSVFLPGMEALCRKLILGLNVRQARTDPWQTISMVQGLKNETGADIDSLSFSDAEQLLRARVAKAVLNSYLLTLRGNVRRDKQWRQLQRKGARGVDHPEGGAKDLYDVESMMIWLAANWRCASLGQSLR